MPKRILTEEQRIKNCERAKKWNRQNAERRKAWKELNRERLLHEKKRGCAPKRVFECYKQSAKKRGLAFELSFQDFESLLQNECHHCGNTGRMGIDRFDNSKGYLTEPGQCVPCCSWCNVAKSDGTFKLLLEKARAVVAKHGPVSKKRIP